MKAALKVGFVGWMKIAFALPITILGFTHSIAHDIYTSELTVLQDDSVLHLELRMNAFELESLGGREMIKNGMIDWNRFSEGKQKVINKLEESLMLDLDEKPLHTDKTGLTVDDTHHLIYRAHYRLTEDQRSGLLRIESKLHEVTSRSHVTKVRFKKQGEQENAQLEGTRNSVEFELVQFSSLEKKRVPSPNSFFNTNIFTYANLIFLTSFIPTGLHY